MSSVFAWLRSPITLIGIIYLLGIVTLGALLLSVALVVGGVYASDVFEEEPEPQVNVTALDESELEDGDKSYAVMVRCSDGGIAGLEYYHHEQQAEERAEYLEDKLDEICTDHEESMETVGQWEFPTGNQSTGEGDE